jgi:hypothetical protein
LDNGRQLRVATYHPYYMWDAKSTIKVERVND